jgi:hypothetical protein
VLAEAWWGLGCRGLPEPHSCLCERRHGPGHHVLAVEELEPFGERTRPEAAGELSGQGLLVVVVMPVG